MAEQKQIKSVEILHLDETGYGPEGKHTRREWREECLHKVSLGKDEFLSWQKDLQEISSNEFSSVDYGFNLLEEHKSIGNMCFGRSNSLDFVGQSFTELDLSDYIFLFDVIFDGAKFDKELILTESVFNGERSSFKNATFGEGVQLFFSNFQCAIDFSYATFKGPLLSLFGTKYESTITFDNAVFESYVDFSDSIFNSKVEFRNVTFKGKADFYGIKFQGFVVFLNGRFIRNVSFSKSQFSSRASFIMCTFESSTSFREVVFDDDVTFEGAKFNQYVNYEYSLFNRDAIFSESIFKNLIMDNVSFKGSIDFKNSDIENVVNFEGSKFLTDFPAFRGCKIDKTLLEFSSESRFPESGYSIAGIKNISFLKRLSDHHGQVDQAIEFNAMELRAKKALTWEELFTKNAYGTFSFWLFTALYEKLSDYGRSFMRPLVWFVVICAITWVFAFNAGSNLPSVICDSQDQACVDKQPKFQLSAQRAATEYTLYRASGLIHFSDKGKELPAINERLFGQPIEPWQMRAWGLFMSFASTVLFFFIALGLRNRYRIK